MRHSINYRYHAVQYTSISRDFSRALIVRVGLKRKGKIRKILLKDEIFLLAQQTGANTFTFLVMEALFL